MSNNLFLINSIMVLMVSMVIFVQINNTNNFAFAMSYVTISRTIKNIIASKVSRRINIQRGMMMMSTNTNSNGGKVTKISVQKEKGMLFSARVGSQYTMFLYVGDNKLGLYKRGTSYLIPTTELKIVATNISFKEKCSLVNGFKTASDWTDKAYSLEKMETFFWKSQKTGYAGLVGKNVNDSTTVFDILYGLVLLGTTTIIQASDILCLALGFVGNEGKAGGRYIPFDRASVTIDGVKETAILITPKAYNNFISSLKSCTISDNFFQIIQDVRFVFAYTSEKIIDSPKKDIGINPTLLSVEGVKSSRQIKIVADATKNGITGVPEVKVTKDLMIQSPQIMAKKDLSSFVCDRVNALYGMDYTDEIISFDKIEATVLVHSDKKEDVITARFVYSTFNSGFAVDISTIEEDDDVTMSEITEERKELESRLAQMLRRMFGKNIPAMVYSTFYAAYMKKRTDKAISKDNIPNNFPSILREEMITFVNGGRDVECWENIMISKYTEKDHGSLRRIIGGVDVQNGSILKDKNIDAVCEYDHDMGMLRHFVEINRPVYDKDELVFIIKKEAENVCIEEGNVVGIFANNEGRKVVPQIYVDGDLAVCQLQHDVKGHYFSMLNGRYGVVTSVINSQPWTSKNEEELCYSVITIKAVPLDEEETETVEEETINSPIPTTPTEAEENTKFDDSDPEDLPEIGDLENMTPEEAAAELKKLGYNVESV